MIKPIPENDARFLEIVFRAVRKIDPEILIEVTHYLHSFRVELQSKEEYRGRLFNKLYHIHNLFSLQFKPSQFIKKDKNVISFDLG